MSEIDYKKCSDTELLLLMKDDDNLSFTEIYNRYWVILFIHAKKMLRDEHLASDVVQDVFTIVWQKRSNLEIKSNLSSYLYSAVRNKIITTLNKSKLRSEHLNSLQDFITKGNHSTEEWIHERQLAETIEAEIKLLPAKMRTVFELSRKEHLSYHEIADKLDITQHTVRKQISNVIKLLRSKISQIILFF